MKKINLSETGMRIMGEPVDGGEYRRRALLVYAGEFKSIDGPVSIRDEDIERICENHNAKLAAIENPEMKDFPPIQLDHSPSAKDTVGRLVGPVERGELDGLPAIFGQLQFMGEENWEKVQDGRWTHLSISADLDAGEIIELSVTPFPAAKKAAMLSAGNPDTQDYQGHTFYVQESSDKGFKVFVDDQELPEIFENQLEANEHAKKCIDSKLTPGETPMTVKDEGTPNEPETQKETEGKKVEFSNALKAFGEKSSKIKLALKTANIKTRLSAFRAQGKITPAEIKKINLCELSNASKETIDAVLKTYENRQPVILAGQVGSSKGIDAATISQKAKIAQLESETRANMRFTAKCNTKNVNLSDENTSSQGANIEVEIKPESQNHDELWGKILSSIASGDEKGARDIYMAVVNARKSCLEDDGENQMNEDDIASLTSAFAELEGDYETVVRLSAAK